MASNIKHYSISLAVNDIRVSKQFYENLGFKSIDGFGSVEEKWLILEHGTFKIGLFQDMFEENIITFNPEDARSIYGDLKEKGVTFLMESESLSDESGPCHFCIADPDGNQILYDQHND